MNATDLGFDQLDETSWRRSVRGIAVLYRSLHLMDDLIPVEAIQSDVFGATDLDIYAAGQLMTFAEVGGHVLSASIDGKLAGALIGIGGMISGIPKIMSDWMGIYPHFRSYGIGGDLKRLQAIVALDNGYQEVFWTVDPLRAANARLNFGKLGAWCDQYEENRYGTTYGEALYGGLPSDRLHMQWTITDPAVQEWLVSPPAPLSLSEIAGVPVFKSGIAAERALIPIPNDIDAVLSADRDAALNWRMQTRAQIPSAFVEGFIATGFVGNCFPDRDASAIILTRRHT